MIAAPHWDSAARELWWAGRCVKQFHNDAALQRALLDALEAAGWPSRIENPLPGGQGVNRKKRLQSTVKNLNRGLAEGTIRFHMDGTAEAVRWEIDA